MNRHGERRASAPVAVALPDHAIKEPRQRIGVGQRTLASRPSGRIQALQNAARLRDLIGGEQLQGDGRGLHPQTVIRRHVRTLRTIRSEVFREGRTVRVRVRWER